MNPCTHGQLDGNAHPGVVLVVMDVAGAPAFRCSEKTRTPENSPGSPAQWPAVST